MLSCQDCERYLYAFLDNALGVKASIDIQEHLGSCFPCTRRVEVEQTLRRFLRQHGRVNPLPEALKYRIVRQAMYRPPGRPWWRQTGVIRHVRDVVTRVAAAAVVLLAL